MPQWGRACTMPRVQSTVTYWPSRRREVAPAAPTITGLPRVRPTVAAWPLAPASSADDGGRLPDIAAGCHWWCRAPPARRRGGTSPPPPPACGRCTAGRRRCLVPMPTAFSSAPPTRWTLIMLVVPDTPTGTPAVTTTRSPVLHEAGLLRCLDGAARSARRCCWRRASAGAPRPSTGPSAAGPARSSRQATIGRAGVETADQPGGQCRSG